MHAPHLGCPQLPQLPQSKSRQHWPQISSPQPTHVRCRRPRWIVKQRTHMPVEVPRLRSIRARSRSRPDCEISLQPSSLRQTREAGSTEMSCEAVTAVQERSSCSMFSRECRLSIVSDVQPPKDAVRSSVQSPSPAMAASVSLFASATFTCWSPAAALRTTCKKSLSVKIKACIPPSAANPQQLTTPPKALLGADDLAENIDWQGWQRNQRRIHTARHWDMLHFGSMLSNLLYSIPHSGEGK
eukprot:459236-Pleurochrysis_carterae.AAC.1